MASTSGRKPKRLHKTLTINEKIEILDQIGKKSYTVLCEEYGVGKSMITDIKKREPKIRTYKRKMMEMGVGWSAKVMKLGKDEEFEAALFVWFKQKREEGVPITGPIVQAKARELHQQLNDACGDREPVLFTTLLGWLWRFCR